MATAVGSQRPPWRRFVAIGDSFTEGVGDERPDGTLRGWADVVASSLAERSPGLQYANLAIRGRRFHRVLVEQVPLALEMRPDLVSFAAGGNDALRPGFNMDRMMDRFDGMVSAFRESGADVVLFRFADLSQRLPLKRVLYERIVAMNDAVVEVGARHGAHVIDMFSDPGLAHPAAWAIDRLHLGPLGHRRVAAHVLEALGWPSDPSWLALPELRRESWLRSRRADVRWAYAYLGPWVQRRLAGRSSGDGRLPKRPLLDIVNDPAD
ncbi:MAG TPA: SGNH/GDSL hydrolase family protein [Jiangellaceae bacterium]